MNTEKRTEAINEASKLIASRAEVELHSIYMKGYHEGRHDYREKVQKYLIINPEYKEMLKEMSTDLCKNCDKALTMLKCQCLSSDKCNLKQNQLVAIDILEHYK